MRFVNALLILLCFCCTKENPTQDPLLKILDSQKIEIKRVIENIDEHELQIRYTEIIREADTIIFKDHDFNINDSIYFYPASSVKLPVAVLALEKLNADFVYSINTPFYVEGDSSSTTFKKEINKIFGVSDNQAYNRLFEFLGKDHINNKLHEKGLKPSRISHRLSTDNAYDLQTKALIFHENDSTLSHTQPISNKAIVELQLENIQKGTGYYSGEELITEPFDFSQKNYLPLTTLHNTMKRIVFPSQFKYDEQFHLNDSDRDFLLNSMSSLPKASGYISDEYYDSFVKFLMFGDKKDPIPEHIRIYNKVGYAYGYLTDCAYIKDDDNDIDFLVTATIHVNKDGIFNDDLYEYEDIGIPFLAELGRQLYQYELTKE
jgi:hypothetical protein